MNSFAKSDMLFACICPSNGTASAKAPPYARRICSKIYSKIIENIFGNHLETSDNPCYNATKDVLVYLLEGYDKGQAALKYLLLSGLMCQVKKIFTLK